MSKPNDKPKRKSVRTDPDGLTQREVIFVRQYLINGGNGTRAALAAGYGGNSAHRAVYILRRQGVIRVIERERARMLQKLDITAERVLLELARVAFFSPVKLFRRDGTLIPISELDADTAAAISVAETRLGKIRLKLHNKVMALQILGQWLKLWDGEGNQKGDRLAELVRAIHESPSKMVN